MSTISPNHQRRFSKLPRAKIYNMQIPYELRLTIHPTLYPVPNNHGYCMAVFLNPTENLIKLPFAGCTRIQNFYPCLLCHHFKKHNTHNHKNEQCCLTCHPSSAPWPSRQRMPPQVPRKRTHLMDNINYSIAHIHSLIFLNSSFLSQNCAHSAYTLTVRHQLQTPLIETVAKVPSLISRSLRNVFHPILISYTHKPVRHLTQGPGAGIASVRVHLDHRLLEGHMYCQTLSVEPFPFLP